MRFFLGGYGSALGGSSAGIGVVRAGGADDALAGGQLSAGPDAVQVDGSPSWLAWHPFLDVVYGALEGAGVVQAFRRVDDESFVALGEPVDAGELVCHVAVAPDGRWLVASCWGDGAVVRMALDAEGVPASPVIADAAADPYADVSMDMPLLGMRAALERLAAPEDSETEDSETPERVGGSPRPSRAHQARFLPRGALITTDLGLDHVRVWNAADGGLRETERVALPRGSGPRHAVWHPSGHLYVVTELSLEAWVLAPSGAAGAARHWRIVGATQLSSEATVGTDFAAEIALSRDAEFVYAGVRGSNTIATLRVRGSGAELSPVALVESGVDWPRHHVVVRDTLLVAGQRSNEVASLTLDQRTGVPGRVRHRVEAASPSRLLPDRA